MAAEPITVREENARRLMRIFGTRAWQKQERVFKDIHRQLAALPDARQPAFTFVIDSMPNAH